MASGYLFDCSSVHPPLLLHSKFYIPQFLIRHSTLPICHLSFDARFAILAPKGAMLWMLAARWTVDGTRWTDNLYQGRTQFATRHSALAIRHLPFDARFAILAPKRRDAVDAC